MENKILLEICCGGYEDALAAEQGGADRIELNSALYMGGLTPGLGTLRLTKRDVTIPVIAMVRPRGGGFCYSEAETEAMLWDAESLLTAGADGIAFGFLTENRRIDVERTKKMISLIHSYQKEAVFHRAIDCTENQKEALEVLIEAGADRVLTSGGKATAPEGRDRIRELQRLFGDRIELLAGSGVNKATAEGLVKHAGISQVHSSCRSWKEDATTRTKEVSYAYAPFPQESSYECVSREMVRELSEKCAEIIKKI